MNKAERKINDFSSGMKKLDDKSLKYIHKLAQVLFAVEHSTVFTGLRKKAVKTRKKNHRKIYCPNNVS